jgi:hypothetical protein
LRQENERLGSLLDNRDDMLREAKKMRKELRASLEDARTRVAKLEAQVLDSKLEIDSLKASPVVSDEVDCADCSIFLVDLALFIVAIVGEMAIRMSFASRGSERREWRRSGLTRTSITPSVVYLSLVCRCPGPRQVRG